MLKKKYVVLDNDELADDTLYDSIEEAQDNLICEDFKDNDTAVVYELVPKSEYVAPAKRSWKKVK
jgi:hypothetical protein